jgi:hypothetical protein
MFERPTRRLAVSAAILVLAGCSTSPTPLASGIPSTSPVATLAPTPVVTPTPVPEPTPAGSAPVSAAAPCAPSDVKASHDLVDGAAGSRLTTVVLVASGVCSVEAWPAFALRDADGAPLVASSAGAAGRIDLVPAAQPYESVVRLSNWCAAEPRFPLTLDVVVNGQPILVTGSSFPEEGDLPPCNGGSGPILEANAWEAAAP